MVRIRHFHCWGPGSIPAWGTKMGKQSSMTHSPPPPQKKKILGTNYIQVFGGGTQALLLIMVIQLCSQG